MDRSAIQFSGKLCIHKVQGVNLAAEDTLTGSSDPFFVINFPDGQHLKSHYRENNLNPEWDATQDKLDLWQFTNLTLESAFEIELWDYDHVGSNDLIGVSTFRLEHITHMVVKDEWIERQLSLPKRPSDTKRGTVRLQLSVQLTPQTVLLLLETSMIQCAVDAICDSNCDRDENSYDLWFQPELFHRMLQIATGTHPATVGIQQQVAKRLSCTVANWMGHGNDVRELVNAAVLAMWNSDAARIIFVENTIARTMNSPFAQLTLPLAAQWFTWLMERKLAPGPFSDLCELFEKNPSVLLGKTRAVEALEAFCLTEPLSARPTQTAARLLCSLYLASDLQPVEKASTLQKLFTKWLRFTQSTVEGTGVILKAFEKCKVLLDETAIFHDAVLPFFAQQYWTPITQLALQGAVPPLPPKPAAPMSSRPAATAMGSPAISLEIPAAAPATSMFQVTPMMPQSSPQAAADEDACYEFQGRRVTFVQELSSHEQFIIAAASLKVPAACDFPTTIVKIWASDRLPDLTDLNHADTSGDSGALFFSQALPEYLHPALYLDARTQNWSYQFTSAVSQYLRPTKYLVIQLHPGWAEQTKHQLSCIRVLGYAGSHSIVDSPGFKSVVASAVTSLPGHEVAHLQVQSYPLAANTEFDFEQSGAASISLSAGDCESTELDNIYYVGNTYYPSYYSSASGCWLPHVTSRYITARRWRKPSSFATSSTHKWHVGPVVPLSVSDSTTAGHTSFAHYSSTGSSGFGTHYSSGLS